MNKKRSTPPPIPTLEEQAEMERDEQQRALYRKNRMARLRAETEKEPLVEKIFRFVCFGWKSR